MNNFLNYIDPGTGSMLFTIIIGVATTAIFLVRGVFIKLKYRGHGKQDADRVPYVFFSDSKNYWTTFKPICDEFEKRGVDCEYWTMSEDDPGLEARYSHVTAHYLGTANVAFSKLNTMKADMCLATTPGLDVLQWKRSKEVGWYSFIFHDISDGLGYRMFALDYYDAVLGTGSIQENVVRKLEELRHLPAKEVKTVGCVYVDGLLKRMAGGTGDAEAGERPMAGETGDAEAGESIVAGEAGDAEAGESPMAGGTGANGAGEARVTVLLAPSWGPSSILNRYGKSFIQTLIDTGYRIVIRPHPQSKISEKPMIDELQAAFPDIEWNFDRDNFKCLKNSDILISDFSSVMFDYAFVFGKTFIYTETDFDKRPYDAVWVEEEPWHFRALPQLGYQLKAEDVTEAEGNPKHLKDIIDEALSSDIYKEGRDRCMGEAWSCRGHAAERIADYLIAKRSELFGESDGKIERGGEGGLESDGAADEGELESDGAAGEGELESDGAADGEIGSSGAADKIEASSGEVAE